MDQVAQLDPQIQGLLRSNRADVRRHWLIHDQIGDHAVILPGIGQHALRHLQIPLHDLGIAEIFRGLDPDPIDDLQPGCLHQLELIFRHRRPRADAIEPGRLDVAQILTDLGQIGGVRVFRIFAGTRARLVADGIDKELVAVDVVRAVLDFNFCFWRRRGHSRDAASQKRQRNAAMRKQFHARPHASTLGRNGNDLP